MPKEYVEISEVKYAGFGMRMLASTIDCILVTFILMPFYSIFEKIHGSNEIQKMLASGVNIQNIPQEQLVEFITRQLISFSLQIVVITIFVIVFWIYRSATPGKILLKMKIIDAKTGLIPTTKQFVIRYCGYLLSVLPLGIGFIWIYYDKKHQGIHDKLAGTIVVYN